MFRHHLMQQNKVTTGLTHFVDQAYHLWILKARAGFWAPTRYHRILGQNWPNHFSPRCLRQLRSRLIPRQILLSRLTSRFYPELTCRSNQPTKSLFRRSYQPRRRTHSRSLLVRSNELPSRRTSRSTTHHSKVRGPNEKRNLTSAGIWPLTGIIYPTEELVQSTFGSTFFRASYLGWWVRNKRLFPRVTLEQVLVRKIRQIQMSKRKAKKLSSRQLILPVRYSCRVVTPPRRSKKLSFSALSLRRDLLCARQRKIRSFRKKLHQLRLPKVEKVKPKIKYKVIQWEPPAMTEKGMTEEQKNEVIIKRYYWLLRFREGFPWHALNAVVTSLRQTTVRHYIEELNLNKKVPLKRSPHTKWKFGRWLPKPLHKLRQKFKRQVRVRRYRQRSWLGYLLATPQFDLARVTFEMPLSTPRLPQLRVSLYGPRRLNYQLGWSRKREPETSVTGVVKGWKKIAARPNQKNTFRKQPTFSINRKVTEYKVLQFRRGEKRDHLPPRKSDFSFDENYQIKNVTQTGWFVQKFSSEQINPSSWQIACHRWKSQPSYSTTSLTSKFFGLFLRAGCKAGLEKLTRQFRARHKDWSVLDLYKNIYVPVGLITSTRTTVNHGKVRRQKRQITRLDRLTAAVVRARKWIKHGVHGRRSRGWWPRVVSEMVTPTGANRLKRRYLAKIIGAVAVV